MKATEASLLSFLKKSPQFIIPIYQRTYSWTEKECRQLWSDVVRAGNSEAVSVHFVGSIVYIEEGLSQVSHQAPLLVIDGQQRLTTITLLLMAICNAIGDDEPVEGFSARKLRNYYLVNPEEDGDRFFKLLLTQTDKLSLTSIIEGKDRPKEQSIRVFENFELFESLIEKNKPQLAAVCRGLAKLIVVDVALSRDQDNPQLIFESMNSTGRELSQADLIRNYVLMGLEPKAQTRLYNDYWRPMELAFGQEAYTDHFDGFMRNYLTLKTGDIPKKDEVYEAFKAHARRQEASEVPLEPLVRDVKDFAEYFCALALGKEDDPDLRLAFSDLRELKVEVSYPFLLELYHDFKSGRLDKDELIEIIRLVEAYVFRRAICSIPTNSLNKTFANFTKGLEKTAYVEAVKARFMLMPSYRRFPKDDEFKREVQLRDLYNFRSRSYWLRRLENYGRKERVRVDDYTIEHIMPQNEKLPEEWRKALGAEWKRVHESWLHTLGNLTLTGYNSEYNDRPFPEKRDMVGGFRESPLRVNQGLGQLDAWNEDEIKSRAARLADVAATVWAAPEVKDVTLDKYRVSPSAPNGYSIEDHPKLTNTVTKPLYEALRKEVLALDPCVYEEFLKLYVAFKAETNFVDIVPRASELVLRLNLDFSEINDPKNICRDITGLGRWGNGNVEARLSDLSDLPYIIGLIRQSLEKQLGNGE